MRDALGRLIFDGLTDLTELAFGRRPGTGAWSRLALRAASAMVVIAAIVAVSWLLVWVGL